MIDYDATLSDMNAEEIVDAMPPELLRAIAALESLGSVKAMENLGLLKPGRLGDGQALREIAPPSWGGENGSPGAEYRWEKLVEAVIARYGADAFDRIRTDIPRTIRQLMEEHRRKQHSA